MENQDWRARIRAAIKEKKLSMRRVSLDAGKAEGYLHSILADGKDPSIDNLTKVCEVIGISLPYALYGYDMTPETVRLLQLFESHPEKRDSILKLMDEDSTK